MGEVIRFPGRFDDGGGDNPSSITSISTLRLITNMNPEDFAGAISCELGWPLPLFVYLQWETSGGPHPPAEFLDAARRVASRNPIENDTSSISRRHFLGGVIGLSTLATTGLPIRARSLTGAWSAGTAGDQWRLSPDTVTDLETLVHSYRRAYGGEAPTEELLPGAIGLMNLLVDLGRRNQWPGSQARLASLVGQLAVLVGLLNLMGPRNLDAARAHYSLALRAAREAEDWDLASYALGSLAFQATSAQRPADAQAICDAAWNLALRRANPRTRAWVAALASELRARQGDESASRRLIEQAFIAIAQTPNESAWKGVGWFDEARLAGYEGGNLVLLGHHSEAEQLLRTSLKRLDPLRVKHRCTLSADLAAVLLIRGALEESCARAREALTLATSISHRESIDRVRGVHFRLLRWRTHPCVRQLTDLIEVV